MATQAKFGSSFGFTREEVDIDAFRGRFGETQWNGNHILAVGITYDSKSGEHQCRIEKMAME